MPGAAAWLWLADATRTSTEADAARQAFHVLANEATTAQDGGPHGTSVELWALILPHVRQTDGAYALDRVLNTTHQFRRTGGKRHITRRA